VLTLENERLVKENFDLKNRESQMAIEIGQLQMKIQSLNHMIENFEKQSQRASV